MKRIMRAILSRRWRDGDVHAHRLGARLGIIACTSLAMFLGVSDQALATTSAGCTAVNGGGFNDVVESTGGVASDTKTIANFAVGDKVHHQFFWCRHLDAEKWKRHTAQYYNE